MLGATEHVGRGLSMTTKGHKRRPGSRATRTAGAPRVFFSYRRSDSIDVTTHLVDKIRDDIGSENVFRDSDDLIAGTQWKDALDEAIDTCDAAVFVIGPEWTGPRGDGQSRIHDPDDPVAAEVARATDPEADCTAIPVLVDRGGPPDDLPPKVAPLFERHAISSSRADLVDTPTKAYQGVLIGVWESIRSRTPNGVLVIGDEDASAHLDEVIAEMKEAKLIDARHLSRFAAGACVVSARRIRKGARKWPDAIVVTDRSHASPVLAARLRALDHHPGIRNVSLIGAGIAAGFAIGQVLGTASGASAGTTFAASSQVTSAIPEIGTGPLGAASSAWSQASGLAKVVATGGAASLAVGSVVVGQAVTSPDSGAGILVADEPVRFAELDYQVVDTRRSAVRDNPAGNTNSAETLEDPDPSEDWVFVDLDVSNPTQTGDLGASSDHLSLVTPDGTSLRPSETFDRNSGRYRDFYAEPNRTREFTAVFAVDADVSFDGGWLELDQQGYLPAALGGPLTASEQDRNAATLETTSYAGPFSRSEAEIGIVEAYWSRELGPTDDGRLIGSPSNSSRRPPVDHAWLIVHFDLTCIQGDSANTGGCNVASGAVNVDGRRSPGSFLNGLVGYGMSEDFWAAYPVPFEADSVVLQIGEPGTGASADFVVTDLGALRSTATREP